MAGGKGRQKTPPTGGVDTTGGDGNQPDPLSPTTAAAATAATQAQQAQMVQQLQAQIANLTTQLQALSQQQPVIQQQQQQQQQVQAPAPAPAAFAINPSSSVSGLLDYTDKIHVGIYNRATESLFGDNDEDKFNLKAENIQTLLSLLYDRGVNFNISVLQVPSSMAQIGAQNPQTLNFCKHHREIPKDVLKAYVNSYMGTTTRAAQDDNILMVLMQHSLSKKAYRSISLNREDYTVNNTNSGLLMLDTILDESAVEANLDPQIIHIEIAKSVSKFQELNYSVTDFNDWIRSKVAELQQCGKATTEALETLLPHVFEAYTSSNDPTFVSYIGTVRDYHRDHPSETYNYKVLMSKAKDKYDSIQKDLLRKQAQSAGADTADPIVALKAEIKAQKRTITKLHKKFKGEAKAEAKSSGEGKKKKKKKEWKAFPEELKTKAAPSDASKPLVIGDKEYWFCTKHQKWGRHTTDECEKDKDGATPADSGKGKGRQGKIVCAVTAIVDVRMVYWD